MGSIRLDGLQRVTPHAVINDPSPRVSFEDEFEYKDIKLDLSIGQDRSNAPDGTSVNTIDLKDLRDAEDFKQALFNMFTTMPGQKILNPYFGLNLSHYCFNPINKVTADHIARAILIETPIQDPRIRIAHLSVVGDISMNTYHITFTLVLPSKKSSEIRIKGILNADGFSLGDN
tara:strand:+ start:14 stop:535 length:522 start_codon:yes stop_codon:yes gene_type:complete